MRFVNKNYGIRPYKGRFRVSYAHLILGETYYVSFGSRYRLLKFIKVTRKGFNFLDESTHKCVLRGHMYAKGFGGKEIPKNQTKFNMGIPPWIREIKTLKVSNIA